MFYAFDKDPFFGSLDADKITRKRNNAPWYVSYADPSEVHQGGLPPHLRFTACAIIANPINARDFAAMVRGDYHVATPAEIRAEHKRFGLDGDVKPRQYQRQGLASKSPSLN